MLGLFDKKDQKNKAENKNIRASKGEMKKMAEDDVVLELSEEVLREISGGRGASNGDAREGISEANANQGYAAGEMNDIDGWD